MPEFIQQINFSHPLFLLTGLIPFFILLLSYVVTHYSSNRYCDKSLMAWVVVRTEKLTYKNIIHSKLIVVISWVLFSIALSGPRINIDERISSKDKAYNTAVVFVLDVSRSMLAKDVYPDRASLAKLFISNIIADSKNILFSLVIFSQNAHTVTPLTYDSSVILDELSSILPGMLPVAGSTYENGLIRAKHILSSSPARNKTVILLTDGDFEYQKEYTLIDKDISVNVIGFGTLEGQPLPAKNGGWLTYKNKPVISRLNPVNLKEIAKQNNGDYYHAIRNFDKNKVNALKFTGKTSINSSQGKTIIVWQNLYSWFLIPAIFLFLLSTLKYNKGIDASKAVIITLAILTLQHPNSAYASENILTDANTAYLNQNYIRAEKLYKKSKGFTASLGTGNSLYRQNNYSQAIHPYTQAILSATSNSQRATAVYNLANTYYKLGDYSESIKLYRDALKYNNKLDIARVNLGYAKVIDKKVKKAMALRQGKVKTARPGKGPRSSRIETGVDVGTSKLTLANDDDNDSQLYELNIENKLVKKLIERGIKHSVISSTKVDTKSGSAQWQYDHTTVDMIELLVNQEKLQSFNLWKRLFEIEEGFPAPVETPKIKPGVNPW